MRIEEVKAALGKPVRFRNVKLHCDEMYVMTGCIIRRGNDGFYYQAEIARDNHVIVVRLEDIELTDGIAPTLRKINRRQADNAYDMLHGELNRIFVSDDPEEIRRLCDAAIHNLGIIIEFGSGRLEEKSQ